MNTSVDMSGVSGNMADTGPPPQKFSFATWVEIHRLPFWLASNETNFSIFFLNEIEWRLEFHDSMNYLGSSDKICDLGLSSSISLTLKVLAASSSYRTAFSATSIISWWIIWRLALCWFCIVCKFELDVDLLLIGISSDEFVTECVSK